MIKYDTIMKNSSYSSFHWNYLFRMCKYEDKYALDQKYRYKQYVFTTVILFVMTKHVLQSVFDAKMVY